MNLRQLAALCEVVDHGLRIMDAANATFRAQSSVTRQIQVLERELGFELFVRSRNKLLAITPQGQEVVRIARHMLQQAQNMRRVGRTLAEQDSLTFTIATTHTHARYVLPRVIRSFLQKHPGVKLSIRQGNPGQCCELVALGKADLAICTDPPGPTEQVAQIPCYRLYRSVITPPHHPLLRAKPLTLKTLVQYPLITYDEAFRGRYLVEKAFAENGLKPTIVMSAADADVSKVYVAMGLGIAIFASIVFDRKQDVDLRSIDARHLFKPSTLNVILRRGSFLRTYMVDFIHMFAPKLERTLIEAAMFNKRAVYATRADLPEL